MPKSAPVPDNLLSQLKAASTATLTMQLLKRGFRSIAMRGVAPLAGGQGRIAGPAYTLRFLPFREDLFDPGKIGDPQSHQRRAIEDCPAGAVLVIETGGRVHCGTIGDILALRLKVRGVAGVVTDGAVRDAAGVRATALPVFAGGVAAPASYTGFADGAREVPIACGGVTVLPGDYVVADDDGAIVVPRALAAEVAEAGAEQERLERFLAREIARGRASEGVYPPDKATRAAYLEWLERGEPEDE